MGAAAIFVDATELAGEDDFRPNLTVALESRRDSVSQNEIFDGQASGALALLTDAIVLDREMVAVDGDPAQRLLVTYRQGRHALTLEQWCIVGSTTVLYVSATTTVDQFVDHQPTMVAIVESFKIP